MNFLLVHGLSCVQHMALSMGVPVPVRVLRCHQSKSKQPAERAANQQIELLLFI